MRTQTLVGLLALLLVLLGAGYFILSNDPDSMTKGDAAMGNESMEKADGDEMMEGDTDTGAMVDEGDTSMIQKGTYESYAPEKLALAKNGKVVLFFHAEWCPICRALEADIKAGTTPIPEGVHILKVAYDTATELKQKYGVTYQHTFVQVDAEGKALAKWGDATTLAGALAKIQ